VQDPVLAGVVEGVVDGAVGVTGTGAGVTGAGTTGAVGTPTGVVAATQ